MASVLMILSGMDAAAAVNACREGRYLLACAAVTLAVACFRRARLLTDTHTKG